MFFYLKLLFVQFYIFISIYFSTIGFLCNFSVSLINICNFYITFYTCLLLQVFILVFSPCCSVITLNNSLIFYCYININGFIQRYHKRKTIKQNQVGDKSLLKKRKIVPAQVVAGFLFYKRLFKVDFYLENC